MDRSVVAAVTSLVVASSVLVASARAATADGTNELHSAGLLQSGVGSNVVVVLGLILLVVVLASAFAYRRGVFDRRSTDDDGPPEPTSATKSPEIDSSDPAEPEVVSDRDKVLSLLSDSGGRMKQVHIVEETDWSKSKVSMLLSEMEEDGEISKLRVGRENIVSLAGHEPDAAGSPFESE